MTNNSPTTHLSAYNKFAFGIALSLVLIYACSDDKGKNIPDVSHISVDLKIERFEQDLFALDTNDISSSLRALEAKYPVFSQIFFTNVMGIRPQMISEVQYDEAIKGLVSFPGLRKLYDTVQIVYGDLGPVEAELTEAFQYYKYYFPDRAVPTIHTLISEYTYGAFVADNNILGLGLDFGLGADYPLYNPQYFPQYIRRSMNQDHLPKIAIEALVDDLIGNEEGTRLLDMMIHNGKKLYVLDALMPYTPDSVKLSYTAAQANWCEENEAQMWAYFLTEDLLYSTKFNDIRKLVDHSPNSPGMPPEAPGRTANWMGWQIVKSYMGRHPETTLDELINLKDAQKLLEAARYKPRL